ncbi:MAG: hypothetical protein OXG25_05310 [Gammaproteobacteria bacterium]|nr:hypothetical protein [Gammaproteobacteria bacterium]
MSDSDASALDNVIFHGRNSVDEQNVDVLLEQYKLFVDTSERLVARRQIVNTFFLSVNALVLSALALIAKEATDSVLTIVGVLTVSVAAIVLCFAWKLLVRSYAQLNRGKFAVIHRLERELPAALFSAEWVALERGKNPRTYKPFTTTEAFVSYIFIVIYLIVFIVTLGWQICTYF